MLSVFLLGAFAVSVTRGSSSTCQRMQYSNLCEEYRHTRFPNGMGHETQEEAYLAMEHHLYNTYLDGNTGCHRDLRHFMCMTFFPRCSPSQPQEEFPPCKNLCQDVKESCEGIMRWTNPYDHKWAFSCEGLPEGTDDCLRSTRRNVRIRPADLDPTATVPPARISCRPDQFECIDRTGCIPLSQRCDGLVDCGDMSDERNCGQCSRNAFRCDNGKCINQLQTCDGIQNCGDGSDERQCKRGNIIHHLINDMLDCDCTQEQESIPSYTDVCITDTILKVRVEQVRVGDLMYRYKFKVLDVLKGKKSYRKRKVSFEMLREDGCGCDKPKYRKGKQLFISGDVSRFPSSRGGVSLVISEASVGSFITPTETIKRKDILDNIEDCKIISRNLSRTINVRRVEVET